LPLVYLHGMTTAQNAKTGEGNALRMKLSEMKKQDPKAYDDAVAERAFAMLDASRKNHERERDANKALVDHMFDKTNWKLATKRARTNDLQLACAIRDALAYFCGGAEIQCLPGGRYSVGSLGYYHYCGA
jgi:hypothetical protein